MGQLRDSDVWADRPRVAFGPLSAVVAGAGPTVVLLHGVGLRAEAWGAVMDRLAGDFLIISPDMPGHSESALGAVSGLADYVARVADALQVPALVAGHSMGAMMALGLAASAPEKVRGVVALNAIFERSGEAATAVRARAEALDGVTAPDPGGTLARWFGANASPERAACERWLRGMDPAGYKAAYTVFANEDGPSRAALGAMREPAVFMTGAGDPNSTPQMSRDMAALAPNARAEVVKDAAHMMPMTHADRVADAIAGVARDLQED